MIRRPLAEVLRLSDSGVWGDEDPVDGVSVLRSTNFMSDGSLDLTKLSLRSIDPRKCDSKLLAPGDILLEKSGGGPKQPVGRVCLFQGDARPHSFGNFIARLRPNDSVLGEYLFHFLRYFHATGQTGAYQKQTTGIRNLEFKRFLTILIPLRPLDEQRRIVDILSRAEGILRLRREAEKKAAELVPAIFLEMFGDPATNPRGLPLRRVADFVARFEGGKNLQAGSPGGSDFKILKISAVTSGTYLETESKPTPDDYEPPQAHFVREGDLLFSRANTVELVGATALVEQTDGLTLLPDKLWRFVWSEEVDPLYMLALFQTPGIRQELGRLSTGTSASMRNISQGKLFNLRLPVAAVEAQREFGRRCELARSIRRQQMVASSRARETLDALLSRAFSKDDT